MISEPPERWQKSGSFCQELLTDPCGRGQDEEKKEAVQMPEELAASVGQDSASCRLERVEKRLKELQTFVEDYSNRPGEKSQDLIEKFLKQIASKGHDLLEDTKSLEGIENAWPSRFGRRRQKKLR